MSRESLRQILESANRHNEEKDVTGLLIYLKDRFIQLLEGDQEKVLSTFDSILKDDRHQNVSVLLKGESEKNVRLFPDWSMALKIIESDEELEKSGFKNLSDVEEIHSTNDSSHPGLIFMKYFSNQALKHYELELSSGS